MVHARAIRRYSCLLVKTVRVLSQRLTHLAGNVFEVGHVVLMTMAMMVICVFLVKHANVCLHESVVANSFVPSDFLVDGQVNGLGTVHPLLTLGFIGKWILPLHVVSCLQR